MSATLPALPHLPIVHHATTPDQQSEEQETKKDLSLEEDLPTSPLHEDSGSSIDLLEPGTGAVVLPWRVKVPAMLCVIFFTCKSVDS
jgi:hypothetical protein